MTLTPAQLTTFKADILANADPVVVQARSGGDAGAIANWYNLDSTFTVYRTFVSLEEHARQYSGSDLGNMTTGNTDRVQMWHNVKDGVRPNLASDRDFFTNTFSGTAGATTRAALAAIWVRLANRVERLFATGTGTPAAPGQLVFEGSVTHLDVVAALNS